MSGSIGANPGVSGQGGVERWIVVDPVVAVLDWVPAETTYGNAGAQLGGQGWEGGAVGGGVVWAPFALKAHALTLLAAGGLVGQPGAVDTAFLGHERGRRSTPASIRAEAHRWRSPLN